MLGGDIENKVGVFRIIFARSMVENKTRGVAADEGNPIGDTHSAILLSEQVFLDELIDFGGSLLGVLDDRSG